MRSIFALGGAVTLMSWAAAAAAAPPAARAADATAEPAVLTVTGHRVANLRPASTYPALATVLRYDPQVDVQSRGLPEGQADVSVRGGLFENTGVAIGAATLLDPQTGHYGVEVPVDPAMLSAPEILTGIDNALAGFNATVATVQLDLAPVTPGGQLVLGAGSDDLRFLEARGAGQVALEAGGELGAEVSYASSRSDGSRANGDHEFDRVSTRLQHVGDGHRSDLVYGYQDKFFGWPGAYTGFESLAETDHTQTHLLLANHRRDMAGTGWWQVTGYYRELENDYDFDRTTRESGVPGAFQHETRSYSVALQGLVPGGAVDWRLTAHLVGDELVRSTDLTRGDFDTRRYARLAVAPEKTWTVADGARLTVRGGVTLEDSNRDEDAILPAVGVVYSRHTGTATDTFTLEYAATSQVPGYTALKSPPQGLFGGNADLGRERADTVLARVEREASAWYGSLAVFYREDDDLVDWTFAADTPSVRQANPVDMEVKGVEAQLARRWRNLEVVGAYTYLDKNEDYGAAAVDASFYALNYAEQRMTLAVHYQPFPWLDIRWDNELRRQRDNALRTSDDDAYLASLALGFRTPVSGLRASVTVDNLADSDFQDLPGTPAPRRRTSVDVRYAW